MYDLIIIGSGPAGLTAAIYATRAKLNFICLEQNFVSGGQIIDTYEIDNYPALPGISGIDLAMKMREHADNLGAEFINETVTEVDLTGDVKRVTTDETTYEAKTVIIACGARHRKLGVPGEEEFAGQGVSSCAPCDGAFYKGATTAVVGGGDVAVEDAIFLARLCKKVYIIHRRDEFRAAKVLSERLLSLPNVEPVWDSVVHEIVGGKSIGALHVDNVKDGSRRILQIDGVFIAVGIEPLSDIFKGQLAVNEGGYIIADETGATSIPGVFAAGDIRSKQLRQIITACGDGANCVTSVENYLLTH